MEQLQVLNSAKSRQISELKRQLAAQKGDSERHVAVLREESVSGCRGGWIWERSESEWCDRWGWMSLREGVRRFVQGVGGVERGSEEVRTRGGRS